MKNQLLAKIIAMNIVLLFSQTQAKHLECAYLYSTQARAINTNTAIPLDVTSYITSYIKHIPGSAEVQFRSKGIYKITFSISSVQPNQIALYKNDTLVAGSIFGSGNRIQQNTGAIIIEVEKDDTIFISNISPTPINLQTLAGGSQANVNAYLLIEELDA